MKKRLTKTLTEITVVISVGLLYYLWVRFTGLRIPCVFNEITGFTCPGCGITRMLVALISFNIVEAFNFNPALFFTLPFIGFVLAVDKIDYIREGVRKKRAWKNVIIISSTVILIGFCIYRNIQNGFDNNSLFGVLLNLIQK